MTSDAASMGALQGYRIIDMTSMISGPLGTVLDRWREPDTQSTSCHDPHLPLHRQARMLTAYDNRSGPFDIVH